MDVGSEEIRREDKGSGTQQRAGWGGFKMQWENKVVVLKGLMAVHFCWAALL